VRAWLSRRWERSLEGPAWASWLVSAILFPFVIVSFVWPRFVEGGYELTGWAGHVLLAVPATLAYALAFLVVVFAVTGGVRSLPRPTVAAVVFGGFCFTPFGGWALVAYLDTALDTDPGRVVDVRLARRVHTKGHDRLEVGPWDGGDTLSLDDLDLPSGTAPGSLVSIRVHPGALGLEWVETRPVPPRRPAGRR
jgi:hypothetical protein